MELYQWIMVLGLPSFISGIGLIFINRTIAKQDSKHRAAQEAIAKRDKEIKEQTDAMEKQNAALMLAVQAMLRDRLLQGYRHYIKEKGWADYDDRENLENIWNQYHALGANGIMDGYRARFLALPVEKDVEMEV